MNLSFAGLLKQLCTILMASGVPADVLTEVGNFSYLFVCVHLPHNFYLLLLIIQSMLQHLFYIYFVEDSCIFVQLLKHNLKHVQCICRKLDTLCKHLNNECLVCTVLYVYKRWLD